MSDNWVRAISEQELKAKRSTVVRVAGKQLAMFDNDGDIFACNNRCPHEGYPLSEGSLDSSCVLTCNWHNWKFDLCDGSNLYGGDKLRIYPIDIRDGDIWVDLSEPPLEERRRQVLENLRDAYDDHEYDRIAREVGRWQLLGADPVDTVAAAIDWSYDRMEFGWTHAFAGTADWLTLYDEHAGDLETQLICVLESIGHMSDDLLRESTFPYTEKRSHFSESDFLDAVETEDEARAVAMIRGAVHDEVDYREVHAALARAALAHYNDFGHSLIYVEKVGGLISRLGSRVALPLLLSLVRGIVFATREDKIPEFRGYAKALKHWGTTECDAPPDVDGYRRLGINKALELTHKLSANEPEQLFDFLLGANCINMVGFDLQLQNHIDRTVDDNVSWLDFTHTITFADAVWQACRELPDTWPAALLQLACFSGRNAGFTVSEVDCAPWRVEDPDRFFADSVEHLFDHAREEYIVSVHLLKTVLAARRLYRQRPGAPSTEPMLAALNRFLNEPLKRKHVRRTMRQAMSFVDRDG